MAAEAGYVSAGYAELHFLSNFSFQRGASSALELFREGQSPGAPAPWRSPMNAAPGGHRPRLAALGQVGGNCRLIIGSEVRLENSPKVVLLVENLRGYQALCRLHSPEPGVVRKKASIKCSRGLQRTVAGVAGAVGCRTRSMTSHRVTG